MKDRLIDLTFEEIAKEWQDWSVRTFEKASSFSSLNKCKDELNELQLQIALPTTKEELGFEYADCIMCLLHSAAKEGFTIQDLSELIRVKAEINYNRTWELDPSGNTYSHIKK